MKQANASWLQGLLAASSRAVREVLAILLRGIADWVASDTFLKKAAKVSITSSYLDEFGAPRTLALTLTASYPVVCSCPTCSVCPFAQSAMLANSLLPCRS